MTDSQVDPQSEIGSLLAAANAAFRARNYAEAATLCTQLRGQAPQHADVWHLSGLIAIHAGRPTEAIEFLSRAIAIDPNAAPAYANLGVAQEAANMVEAALASFHRAVALSPQVGTFQFLLANCLARTKRHAEAVKPYEEAARLGVGEQAHRALGQALKTLGRPSEAVTAFEQALSVNSQAADILVELGGLKTALGDWAAAVEFFRRALALQPAVADVAYNLGVAYRALGRLTEAETAFRQAISLSPDRVEAHLNLGNVRQAQGRLDEAIADYQCALATGRRPEACYYNLGTAYEAKGEYVRALECLDQAIAHKPDFAEAQRNKGLISLMIVRLADGWRAYEWRWLCSDFINLRRPFTQPAWTGASEQSVLIWGEQGIGDEILYGSMIPDLVRSGVPVVWEVNIRFVPLVQRSLAGVTTVPHMVAPEPITATPATQLPIASLGQHLRASRAAFPTAAGYLRADVGRVAAFRKRLNAGPGEKIIGLSWISKAVNIGQFKSLTLADLAPIVGMPGVRFVDLQYGDTATERTAVKTDQGVEIRHFADLDMFNDIDGLAALISVCDLVITVSNTTAHLAGALGVPVWILVPRGNGKLWYWGQEGAATPWYVSARLFRQKTQGDWREPIAEIAAALVD